uniref:Alpha-1,4 glucan phosphorylase n=1 Tax=Tetraselmis chuii TaxID=63592 RepID=A0A7S1SM83_9CHLO|eukprot:CAMPEP_0177762878 /NCGR_PEP_ID=MMETSP0491_2-20121128/6575_1 /TAXON_ID=63592 /ORGANISM="Tetraselmis chuii, Strain PLY429" /LENGTH=898 /DNA_ID=CAMNT_0019278953 /DNA_START=96 /DNA_END=2792 /DNA_ORIENTATION=-
MYGFANSALLGSRLPMPMPTRVGRKAGASGACAAKPFRVSAVLEDTSKKNDSLSISKDILDKVEFVAGGSKFTFSNKEAYDGTAFAARERLVESFNKTMKFMKEKDPKFVYYLSAEFLMGRSLLNTVYNLGLKDQFAESLNQLGYDLEQLVEEERDAALGNGGLGRLAACFLDSIATLSLPGWGYGIRYRYGMFKQVIDDNGYQQAVPDVWLTTGNPWDIPRYNIQFPVGFYGSLKDGKWVPGEEVMALAYDTPIPGFQTNNTMNLRLWEAKPKNEFDLDAFNTGAYVDAILEKQRAEAISAVLYPNDNTAEGKELRLKQQFFFVSASLQDIIARYKESHVDLKDLPEKAAVQLNDTHPTIGVPELMRLLMDQEGLDWDTAWDITYRTMNFTNHTVMPEALERWPVKVMEKLLPRHMQIIEKIDSAWRAKMEEHYMWMKDEEDAAKAAAEKEDEKEVEEEKESKEPVMSEYEKKVNSVCVIQENQWNKGEMLVNMAYMAVVGSTYVNGVAAIHSDIIKNQLFKDFAAVWPDKFQNKTNGVTPRRWLAFCNPKLAELITETLGTDAWVNDMSLLTGLRAYADDKEFHKKWSAVKLANKERLASKILADTGVELNPESMFDVQIKRIHQYKRQFMNIMSVIYRWDQLKKMSPEERKKVVPRSVIIGGKAATAYDMAKRIVHLANRVGDLINDDPDTKEYLKLVFIPDYNVSWAEVLIPGAELSQHISTAGTEASGTSNMKFQMNGSLIIGTMDGANIEIAEESGRENMFIFGVGEEEVPKLREERVKDGFPTDPRFDFVLDMIREGTFSKGEDPAYLAGLADDIGNMKIGNDWFLVAPDFASYLDAQAEADKIYKDQDEWTKRSILYTAGSAKFSSDRTIAQYASEIWGINPLPMPDDYQ